MTQTRSASRNHSAARKDSASRKDPAHLEPPGSIKLTGRGAIVVLFAACLSGLLIAAWTGWSAVADALFVMSCGVVAYYTRANGLRKVVVCPPLVFFAGVVCAQLITAPDAFSAATGILVTLGTSAPWLFTATALTFVIALTRGYRPQLPAPSEMPVIANLLEAFRRR
jgi:hypothetical protein